MIAALWACAGGTVEPPPVDEPAAPPALTVSSEEIALGTVRIGDEATATFAVVNEGEGDLHATLSVVGDPGFTLDPAHLDVLPGRMAIVDVRWTPPRPGLGAAEIRLVSDDPAHPVATVQAWGAGTGGGRITVSAAEGVDFGAVALGWWSSRWVVLGNPGPVDVEVVDFALPEGVYTTASPPPFVVGAGVESWFELAWVPEAEGALDGVMRIVADDGPPVEVPLAGYAGSCDEVGDGVWLVELQSGVHADASSWAPTLDDPFTPDEWGWCEDGTCQVDEWGFVALRFETWGFAEAPFEWDVELYPDDAGRLYVDGQEVVARTAVDASRARALVAVDAGWHHLQGTLYNGPGNWEYRLDTPAGAAFDRLCSEHREP